MKYAIPKPTYPAITSPQGASSLFEFQYFPQLQQKFIGVVPDDINTSDLIERALNSGFLQVSLSCDRILRFLQIDKR